MKASELRLGNLIIEDGKEIEFNGDFYHWCDDIMKPIPLHIDWLIRFGVNEVKNQDVLRINYVKYYKSDNKFQYCLCFYFDEDGYVDNVFKEIQYVH